MGALNVDLSSYAGDRLRDAVRAAMEKEHGAVPLPTSARLGQTAKATVAGSDADQATYFQSILEIAYLVASADGFADDERDALASLLEQLTGKAVSHDDLELHFKDLDDACEMLGRRERLRRAAEDFAGAGKTEAVGFAAIIALADGQLADPEAKALAELGGHLGMSEQEIADVVASVVARVRTELGAKES